MRDFISLLAPKLVPILVIICFLSACSPYEDKSYFEPVETASYSLDSFSGNTDFTLDVSYDINAPSLNISEIEFTSFDGNTEANIKGIFVGDQTKISTNTIILYCHDKYGNIDNYWQRIKLLAKLGLDQYGILAIDYRGYGKSGGHSSEGSINADVASAIIWLEDRGLTGDRLILYGFGLGTVPVVEIAATPRTISPAKIILEAPIASMELLLQDALYQATPAHYLTSLKFNNADKIKKVSQPLLWFHGEKDDIYPVEHGQLVYDSHTGIEGTSKLKLRVANAGHNNVPSTINAIETDSFQQYLLRIQTFFENH